MVLRSVQDLISEYYKEEYKKKSVYALPEDSNGVTEYGSNGVSENVAKNPNTLLPRHPDTKYSSAAFNFYEKLESSNEVTKNADKNPDTVFSVSNLKCQIIYSDKPIANIVKAGNKSIFEVGTIFDKNMQVIFSGEIVGDSLYQKVFFDGLSDLSNQIYKTMSSNEQCIQTKLASHEINLDEDDNKENQNRKKPLREILYKVWEKDNWTCVYCGKQLLDPDVVKSTMPKASDSFITYTNQNGKEVTAHILKEHSASYDHYLPVSKLPQFNFDAENLFACCFECNRKKSNSMGLKTWKPLRQNNWEKPLVIAGLSFTNPRTFSEYSRVNP